MKKINVNVSTSQHYSVSFCKVDNKVYVKTPEYYG